MFFESVSISMLQDPWTGSRSCWLILVEQSLDRHHVAPLAVKPGVAHMGADNPEPQRLAQFQAGGVFRKDAQGDFPAAGLSGSVEQGDQQLARDAAPFCLPVHVNRKVPDAGIALASCCRRWLKHSRDVPAGRLNPGNATAGLCQFPARRSRAISGGHSGVWDSSMRRKATDNTSEIGCETKSHRKVPTSPRAPIMARR